MGKRATVRGKMYADGIKRDEVQEAGGGPSVRIERGLTVMRGILEPTMKSRKYRPLKGKGERLGKLRSALKETRYANKVLFPPLTISAKKKKNSVRKQKARG